MNQTLSKALLAAGVAWFLYQFRELLTQHSSWSELAEPATFGEVMKLAASVVLTVLGALGTTLPKPNSRALGILVAVAIAAGGSSGCAALRVRPGTPAPAAVEQRKLEQIARTALVIERIGLAMKAVQSIEIGYYQAGQIEKADHLVFQAHLLAWSDGILALKPALEDLTRPEASRRDVIRQAITFTDRLIDLGLVPIRDVMIKLEIRIALATVASLLPLLALLA